MQRKRPSWNPAQAPRLQRPEERAVPDMSKLAVVVAIGVTVLVCHGWHHAP